MGEERIEINFEAQNAKRQLDEINRILDGIRAKGQKIGMSDFTGQVGQVVGAGFGGSATGNAIANFASANPLEKMAQLIETAVRTLLPDIVAKLDVLGRRDATINQIAPLMEASERLGLKIPDKRFFDLYDRQAVVEGRVQAARARLESHANIHAIEDAGSSWGDVWEGIEKAMNDTPDMKAIREQMSRQWFK